MKHQEPVCILTFHGLGQPERRVADGEEEFWLTPSFFEGVLDVAKGQPNTEITFDDANSSDYTVGLPALLRRGMKGTFLGKQRDH